MARQTFIIRVNHYVHIITNTLPARQYHPHRATHNGYDLVTSCQYLAY